MMLAPTHDSLSGWTRKARGVLWDVVARGFLVLTQEAPDHVRGGVTWPEWLVIILRFDLTETHATFLPRQQKERLNEDDPCRSGLNPYPIFCCRDGLQQCRSYQTGDVVCDGFQLGRRHSEMRANHQLMLDITEIHERRSGWAAFFDAPTDAALETTTRRRWNDRINLPFRIARFR